MSIYKDLHKIIWSQFDTNVNNFYPFKVVGRGSETQLQMGENLNKLTCILNCILNKSYLK